MTNGPDIRDDVLATTARHALVYAISCSVAACAIYGIPWAHADSASATLGGITTAIVADQATEAKEKLFFLLSVSGFVLMSVFGGGVLRWARGLSGSRSVAAAAVLFVGLQVAIGHSISTASSLPPWGIIGLVVMLYAVTRNSKPVPCRDWRTAAAALAAQPADYLRGTAVFAVMLLLLFVPFSIDHIVKGVGANTHVVSYFIGPALYERFSAAIPGVDYHTHYSQIAGFLFQPLIADTVIDTYRNYVCMMLVAVSLFYISAFVLATFALRDWRGAVVITVAAFLLNFQTEFSHFFGPSAWPVRFILLNVVGLATCWLMSRPDARSRQWVLGALLSMSVLVMSETGLYMLFACAVTGLLLVPDRRTLVSASLGVGTAGVVVFYAVSMILYGVAIFSWDYHYNLVEALLIYGATGWVSVPLKWTLSWSLAYNLLLPALLLAVIASARRCERLPHVTRTVLSYCSLMGILFHLKWLNTSHDAVIHQAIFPSLVVIGWLVMLVLADARLAANRLRQRTVSALALAAGITLVSTVNDPRQGAIPHGLWSYLGYPSLLKSVVADVHPVSLETWQYLTYPQVVDFIRSNTSPGERVAVFAKNRDWAYLLEAQRAPLFYFTPSNSIFSMRHLERSLAAMDRLFVVTGDGFNYQEMNDAFWSAITRDFVLSSQSAELAWLYVRKQHDTPPTP